MMGCTPDKAYEGILPFCLAQATSHPVLGTEHQERWKINVKLQEWLKNILKPFQVKIQKR